MCGPLCVSFRGRARRLRASETQPQVELLSRHVLGLDADPRSFLHHAGLPLGDLHLQVADHPLRLLLQPPLPAPLQGPVQRVQEGVQSRVDGQDEDGGPHVDLPGDGHPVISQQARGADREPAAEVAEDDEEETASNAHVVVSPLRAGGRSRLADGPVDDQLPQADQDEEEEVQDDEDPKGVALAGELESRDGQGEADGVEVVELHVGEQGHGRQGGSQQPQPGAGHGRVVDAEVEALPEGEAHDQQPVQGDETDDEGGHLAGHEGQVASHGAEGAGSPLLLHGHVHVSEVDVGGPDDHHVHPQQQVGGTQVDD